MAKEMTGHEFLMKLKEIGDKRYQSFDTYYVDYLDQKARKAGIPLNGQYELTPLCNFDCKMCYTHLTKEQMHGKPLLTVDQWKQITDEAYAAGMIRVNLTGGECLTYPGFKEIYLYLHSLGCEIRVLTNGALLDEQWIDFFKAHPPIGIQITLYGGDEDTYERVTGHRMFSVVSANIRRVMKAELPLVITTTPSKYAGAGMLDTIRAAHEFGAPFGISSSLVTPRKETGRSDQDHELSIDDYVTLLRYRNSLFGVDNSAIDPELLPVPGGSHHECDICGLNCGGLCGFDIDWDGTMCICNDLRTVVGKPLEEGFKAAWEKIHRIAAEWPRVPECFGCPYEEVCTNCEVRKASYGELGKQPWSLCERTKYLVQYGVYTIDSCK